MNIDTIYNDVVTNLLPKIQDGLVITKDYFLDLFGRYVKYMIVTDSLWTISGLLLTVISIWLGIYFFRWCINNENEELAIASLFLGISGTIIGLVMFFFSGSDLIKDIYIPEIRIVQEIQKINH